ncbi:copper amine oxidase N-terminal domain-containing protein [Paenibacillus sp. N3/727]|uniref:copper amine oxidase N-terminal domain-containing protein n=1 Tax=Paenibacillus sp. N3/727 TaxID=2925845 RepID=UPI001F5319B3|nr:copper amine oxidase N-terminal domain-containing protein [Paenibacillus sp. N3/727]UNK20787.1 copper amine oxidase N-terminal domain-containing protein [Paenibacillus sp. N3/727]
MWKRINKMIMLVLVLILAVTAIPLGAFAANNDIKVTINGKQLYIDVNPQSIDGRIFVPMRGIFEALGAEIKWDRVTQTVTGIKGETTVKLTINQKQAYINGKAVTLDASATIVKGSTLVPVRFVAESLGADVKWDASTSTVIILQGEVTASDYYYFLYNSKSVSASDLMAIKSYIGKFRSSTNILMDVTEAKDAVEIYKRLQSDSTKQSGKLLGIQIFGASEDVPAFNYLSKTATIFPDRSMSRFDLVLNGESFLTDYFYSNFNNDSAQLKKEISPYAVFDEKTVKIDFEPQWKVVRLPLSKGEIEGYFKRFDEYTTKRNAQKSIPVVNFSSPTYGNIPGTPEDGEDFRDPNDERRLLYQKDDYSYVLQRLDKEFNILENYRLYGNQQGDIKVKTNVSGDYTKDNVYKENELELLTFSLTEQVVSLKQNSK